MRISDWSSDVCSSDLGERAGEALGEALDRVPFGVGGQRHHHMHALAARKHREAGQPDIGEMLLEIDRGLLHMAEIEPFVGVEIEHLPIELFPRRHRRRPAVEIDRSSTTRRVGKGWVITCRSRWSRYLKKKNEEKI